MGHLLRRSIVRKNCILIRTPSKAKHRLSIVANYTIATFGIDRTFPFPPAMGESIEYVSTTPFVDAYLKFLHMVDIFFRLGALPCR